MNLRKTYFILPNLFTLGSVFCGFFAITTVAAGDHPSAAQLQQAAIAILFGVFFDIADGRVARLTRTQSALGLQLDSLADVITFGVAPAVMMYRWGLDGLRTQMPYVGPHIGLLLAFVYVACAALRLARFNVLEIEEKHRQESEGTPMNRARPSRHILGLAVPVAAVALVSLVVLTNQLGGSFKDIGEAALAAIVVVLSYLMVSKIHFRSFKDLRLSRRTVMVAVAAVGGAVVAIFFQRVPSGLLLVALLATYLALGLYEEVVLYQQRRRGARATPADLTEGGARSDEEVLQELGAYEGESPAPPPPDGPRGEAGPPPKPAAASR